MPHDSEALGGGVGAGLGPDAEFQRYLLQGRLMLQRSRNRGAFVFFPRVAFPGTGEADLEWVEASGRGTVYATTTVRRRPDRGGPYNVALIDLDEGVRCMSRVEGIASERVWIGMRVLARIDREGDAAVLVFVPAEAPTGDDAAA
jgi:uncharacterized OB-fold protein